MLALVVEFVLLLRPSVAAHSASLKAARSLRRLVAAPCSTRVPRAMRGQVATDVGWRSPPCALPSKTGFLTRLPNISPRQRTTLTPNTGPHRQLGPDDVAGNARSSAATRLPCRADDRAFLRCERRTGVPVARDDPAVCQTGCFEWFAARFVTADDRHRRCVKDDHVGIEGARNNGMPLIGCHP